MSPIPPATSASTPRLRWIASLIVLLLVIAAIGLLFFRVMRVFLLPLFISVLLAVVFRPVHTWILRRIPKSPTIAALLTTLGIFAIILVPVSLALSLAVSEGVDLAYRDFSVVSDRLSEFRRRFGLELPLKEELETLGQHAARLEFAAGTELPDAVKLRSNISSLKRDARGIGERMRGLRDAPELTAAQRDVVVAATAQLQMLSDAIQDADALVLEGIAGGTYATETTEDGVREALDRVAVRIAKFREELLGGPPRSWLVEAANPSESQFNQWRQRGGGILRGLLLSLSGQTTALLVSGLFGMGVSMISLFYFFLDGERMIKALMRLSPLDDEHELALINEFATVSRAVVSATLISAMVQGILAGIGFYFAGLPPLFLLVILTMVLALIPFVGAGAVWVPVCLWLAFMDGRVGAAVTLAIYSALTVSMADNFIKPWILQGQSNIHPLLGLLSVLGGVQALGPVGLIIGPMAVAFLQALLNILQKELQTMDSAASTTGERATASG